MSQQTQPEWPNIARPACATCGLPEAQDIDYERYDEGEGEHLCWGDPFACTAEVKSTAVAAERDHWIRLWNRLEAAITHHRRDKLNGVDTSDEIDEALWKARDKILRDAAQTHAEGRKEQQDAS